MTDLVNDAADLMAAYDAAAARVFRERPFHRAAIAAAFRKGFKTHSPRTLTVCDILDRVAAADAAQRRLSA